MKSPHLLIVLGVLNVPMYVIVFRKFFGDMEELEGGLSAWQAPIWARMRDALSGQW